MKCRIAWRLHYPFPRYYERCHLCMKYEANVHGETLVFWCVSLLIWTGFSEHCLHWSPSLAQKHLMQGCQIVSKPKRDAFLIGHCRRAAKAVLTGMDAAASHCLKGSSQLKHHIFQDLSSDLSSQKSGRCHSWCDGLGLWSDCCRHVWTKKNGSVFDRFQTLGFFLWIYWGRCQCHGLLRHRRHEAGLSWHILKIWMTWMLKWAEVMLKMLKISDRSKRRVEGYFIRLIVEAEHSKIAHWADS